MNTKDRLPIAPFAEVVRTLIVDVPPLQPPQLPVWSEQDEAEFRASMDRLLADEAA